MTQCTLINKELEREDIISTNYASQENVSHPGGQVRTMMKWNINERTRHCDLNIKDSLAGRWEIRECLPYSLEHELSSGRTQL